MKTVKPPKVIITDFDGTLTLVKSEAEKFTSAYLAHLATNSTIARKTIDAAWLEAKKKVENSPNKYGWKDGDRIVAPARADHRIMARVLAGLALDSLGAITDKTTRAQLLEATYHASSGMINPTFRRGALKFLNLVNSSSGCVVTNSATGEVSDKVNYHGLKPVASLATQKKSEI